MKSVRFFQRVFIAMGVACLPLPAFALVAGRGEVLEQNLQMLEGSAWDSIDPASCTFPDADHTAVLPNPSSTDIAKDSLHKQVSVYEIRVRGLQAGVMYLTNTLPLVERLLLCHKGQSLSLSAAENGSSVFYIPLEVMPGEIQSLRVAFYSGAGPMPPLVIASPEEAENPIADRSLYWGLIGGLIALCFYNMFLWFGARKKNYSLNVYYIASTIVLNFIVGHGFFVLLNVSGHTAGGSGGWLRFLNALNNASGMVTQAAVLAFVTEFLDIKARRPRLSVSIDRFRSGLLALALICFTYVFITGDVQKLNPISRLLGAIVVVMMTYATLSSLLKFKDIYSKLFFCSYLMLCIGVNVWILFLDGHLISSFLTRNSMLIGAFLECLGLSFSVGYRVSRIEQEATAVAQDYGARLLDLNENLEHEVRRHVGDIRAMLDGIREAIFIITANAEGDLVITDERSKYSGQLFAALQAHGSIGLPAVLDETDLSSQNKSYIYSSLISSHGEPLFAFELNEGLLPRNFSTLNGRNLEFSLIPILNPSGRAERFLCAMSDITDRILHQKARQERDLENVILLELLRSPIDKASKNISTVASILAATQDTDPIEPVMRALHTAKGLARSFLYDHLAERLHVLEGELLSHAARPLEALSGAVAILDMYRSIHATRLSGNPAEARHATVRDERLQWLAGRMEQQLGPEQQRTAMALFHEFLQGELLVEFLAQFREEASRLAERLGKGGLRFVVHNDRPMQLADEHLKVLAGIVAHLLRNSLDHGIESRAERQKAGKPEIGTLTFRLEDAGPSELQLTVWDDGQGLDLEAIQRAAGRQGLSDAEALELIFQQGFSTVQRLSLVSGRGVGMDAIRAAARATGGDMQGTLGEALPHGRRQLLIRLRLANQKAIHPAPLPRVS